MIFACSENKLLPKKDHAKILHYHRNLQVSVIFLSYIFLGGYIDLYLYRNYKMSNYEVSVANNCLHVDVILNGEKVQSFSLHIFALFLVVNPQALGDGLVIGGALVSSVPLTVRQLYWYVAFMLASSAKAEHLLHNNTFC